MSEIFEVIWKVEVPADSYAEAAKKAYEMQQDPDSSATVFEVRKEGQLSTAVIDLTDHMDDNGNWLDEEPPVCILTNAESEDPDDCTTHEHEES